MPIKIPPSLWNTVQLTNKQDTRGVILLFQRLSGELWSNNIRLQVQGVTILGSPGTELSRILKFGKFRSMILANHILVQSKALKSNN